MNFEICTYVVRPGVLEGARARILKLGRRAIISTRSSEPSEVDGSVDFLLKRAESDDWEDPDDFLSKIVNGVCDGKA